MIKIDEKDYYTKEEALELFKERGEWKTLIDAKISLTDKANVMGIGSFSLTPGYVAVHVSTDYLKRALQCVEKINNSTVYLAIVKDGVLGVGGIDKDGVFSGVIIAPRIE